MQDKTRIKHRYLQEFCKLHRRHLCAAILDRRHLCAAILDRRHLCAAILDGEIGCISWESRKVEERAR